MNKEMVNSMENNILLYNGNFWRFGSKAYDWIGITNGIITDAGYGDSYVNCMDSYSEKEDISGRLVLPGFYDCHAHFVQTATKYISLDLIGCRSYSDIKDKIEEWIEKNPRTTIIRAFGLEVSNLEEGCYPTRKILDGFTKDYAIWINSRDFHCSILNTRAFHELKVPLAMEGVEYDDNSSPSGRIYGKANALTRKKIIQSYSPSDRYKSIVELSQRIIKKGVTSIHVMEGGFEFYENDARDMNRYKDQLPVDINLFYSTMDFEKVEEMGLEWIGGDVYLDGSFTSKSAAIYEKYNDHEGNGELYFTQDEINEFILKSYEKNLNTTMHAVGDRALECLITAHEHASSIYPVSSLRHRVEHAELASDSQIERASRIGLIFSMQPAYEYMFGGPGKMYERRLGKRYRETNQFRKLTDMGIVICGGSDSDLTPIDPVLGIHAAVNHPVEENRVSVEEAVKFFTINAALSVKEEKRKGSIEIGKLADLVILDRDIFSIAPEEIISAEISATIKNGFVVYRNF